MTDADPDADVRRFSHESAAGGDPTGWFDRLYAAAADGQATVPWDRGAAHPLLIEWAEASGRQGYGSRAIVVGCGTGENAEFLCDLGFDTVAFDISAAAVRTARVRFPETQVDYIVADLLEPPAAWRHAFDLVVEFYTVQSLPPALHAPAIMNTGLLVRPGGTLLMVTSTRDTPPEPASGPPWPLTRDEVTSFAIDGLDLLHLDDVPDPIVPGNRRLRAELRRPLAGPVI